MKNPPLIEVVFELKWQPGSIDEQLLIGTMYSALKDKYSEKRVKENLPPQVLLPNVVTYRFTSAGNKNRLYQLGSGVLTVNFIGPSYDWEEFRNEVERIVQKFIELSSMKGDNPISLSLTYIDFFTIDFVNDSVQDFLRDNLHVNLDTALLTTRNMSLKMSDTINNLGVYEITINTGYKNQTEKGVIVESKVFVNGTNQVVFENFGSILDRFHSFLHGQFEKMIEGPMSEKLNA